MQHIALLHCLLYIEKGSGIGFPVIVGPSVVDRKESRVANYRGRRMYKKGPKSGASREDRSILKEPS